jgi:hypothetical protein
MNLRFYTDTFSCLFFFEAGKYAQKKQGSAEEEEVACPVKAK